LFPADFSNINHPYLGVLRDLRLQESKPQLAMRDVGETLSELLESQPFKNKNDGRVMVVCCACQWPFFLVVGFSALDLVGCTGLRHKDIRPPDIGFRDGAFCIIDFDMPSPDLLQLR
jgi:hypothetical protein